MAVFFLGNKLSITTVKDALSYLVLWPYQRWGEKPIRQVKEKSKACWWSWGEKRKTRIYHIRYNCKRGSLVCTRIALIPGSTNTESFPTGNLDEASVINSFKNRNYSHSKKRIFLKKVIFFSRFSKMTSLHREEKYRKFYRKKRFMTSYPLSKQAAFCLGFNKLQSSALIPKP